MKLEDRISELSFHKDFSKHDFETDCKVFKLWKDVFKDKPDSYDFIVDYYFDLQKRAAKGELSMMKVQKRIYATIVTNMDRKIAVNLPKNDYKAFGHQKSNAGNECVEENGVEMNKKEQEKCGKLILQANELGRQEGRAEILERVCIVCYQKLKQEKVR